MVYRDEDGMAAASLDRASACSESADLCVFVSICFMIEMHEVVQRYWFSNGGQFYSFEHLWSLLQL